MAKPILLLDIDGTLNPAGTDAWLLQDWVEGYVTDDHGLAWGVRTARPVVQFFTALHESGLVEIRWHTTWQKAAKLYGKTFGFPDFDMQNPHPNGPIRRSAQWKEEAVWHLVDEGHNVIWVDDEGMGIFHDRNNWLPGLCSVVPDCRWGLTAADLKQIDDLVTHYAS